MILITGGAGYIGSHCALNLMRAGFDVVIFDSLETGHIETVDALRNQGKVHFIQGDLKDISSIIEVFKAHEIESVIHFAAYSLVGESVINPAKYYRNNVLGTLNLLDAMVENNVKKIVFSSTCATYGEPQYMPLDEKHPQNPINPYGMSKLMVEKIMDDYDRSYGLKSVKLRYFNVVGADSSYLIGENHNPETHLIPNILKSTFSNDQVFKIFGDDYQTNDGTCIRDYVNVEDLADAHRLAHLYLNKENRSDVFNLGTENGNSVKQIFSSCELILGRKIPVQVESRREGDPAILYANSKKAQSSLGWKPKKTIEDSIKTAYEWEKKLNNN